MGKTKKIAIAARGMTRGYTGPNEFIQGLIKGFLDYYPTVDLHIYYDAPDALGHFPGANEHLIPVQNRFLWDHFLLPTALKRANIDTVIFPKGTISFFVPCDAIAIIHDLGYFYPELHAYKPLDTLYMKFALPRSVRKAVNVFTVSENTRQDVIRILGAQPAKVTTIYEAPAAGYCPVKDIQTLERVRRQYQLQQPFIFYPTSISPRKNIGRTLEAFHALQDRIPHHLYLTGSMQWNAGKSDQQLTDHLKAGRVHLLGSVPSGDMPTLYSLADFTIYPSLFEGFGLPIVEAFLCGSPVLTSNLTSLPEVAGDAALIIDGYSTDEIQGGLFRMATDSALRDRLRKAGFERAKSFTWEATIKTIQKKIEPELNTVQQSNDRK